MSPIFVLISHMISILILVWPTQTSSDYSSIFWGEFDPNFYYWFKWQDYFLAAKQIQKSLVYTLNGGIKHYYVFPNPSLLCFWPTLMVGPRARAKSWHSLHPFLDVNWNHCLNHWYNLMKKKKVEGGSYNF